MRTLLLALLHLAVVTAKLCGAGGVRAVMAENLLLKQQLIVLRRVRTPNLTSSDRVRCRFWSMFLSPGRIRKAALALQPRRPGDGGPCVRASSCFRSCSAERRRRRRDLTVGIEGERLLKCGSADTIAINGGILPVWTRWLSIRPARTPLDAPGASSSLGPSQIPSSVFTGGVLQEGRTERSE